MNGMVFDLTGFALKKTKHSSYLFCSIWDLFLDIFVICPLIRQDLYLLCCLDI